MADKQIQYPTLRPMFEELRGTRVVLRPYTLADADERYMANAELRDHLRPWEPEQADAFHTLDETRDWIIRVSADWLLRKRFSMGMAYRNTAIFWVDLDYTHASQMGGLFPRFPSAIGYEFRSKATDTSPRRFDCSQHMCSRCYKHSALKLYVMRETHAVSPLPSA